MEHLTELAHRSPGGGGLGRRRVSREASDDVVGVVERRQHPGVLTAEVAGQRLVRPSSRNAGQKIVSSSWW